MVLRLRPHHNQGQHHLDGIRGARLADRPRCRCGEISLQGVPLGRACADPAGDAAMAAPQLAGRTCRRLFPRDALGREEAESALIRIYVACATKSCRMERRQNALTQGFPRPRSPSALPRRLMVRLRTLTPSIEVRILTGHPAFSKMAKYHVVPFRGSWSRLTHGRRAMTLPTHMGRRGSTYYVQFRSPAPLARTVCGNDQGRAQRSAGRPKKPR